jgi:hypothetical protein
MAIKRHARLSAGRGWTAFLKDLPTRAEPTRPRKPKRQKDTTTRDANAAIGRIEVTMQRGDRAAAMRMLPTTVRLVKAAMRDNGHEARVQRIAPVLRWLKATASQN